MSFSPMLMSFLLGPQVELSVREVACTSAVGQSEGGGRRRVEGVGFVLVYNDERCRETWGGDWGFPSTAWQYLPYYPVICRFKLITLI